jgi:hypothetical protein
MLAAAVEQDLALSAQAALAAAVLEAAHHLQLRQRQEQPTQVAAVEVAEMQLQAPAAAQA